MLSSTCAAWLLCRAAGGDLLSIRASDGALQVVIDSFLPQDRLQLCCFCWLFWLHTHCRVLGLGQIFRWLDLQPDSLHFSGHMKREASSQ